MSMATYARRALKWRLLVAMADDQHEREADEKSDSNMLSIKQMLNLCFRLQLIEVKILTRLFC